MSLTDWLMDPVVNVRKYGFRAGGRKSLRKLYHKGFQFLSGFQDPGTPIYERDWDLLVVLDACRFDLMQEISDEYDFVTDVGRFRSLDSMTLTWMQKNFTPEYADEMAETAYICGNPFSADVLHSEDFHVLDEVWRYTWEDPGTVYPRRITDRTIERARETKTDRIIAHYMQPHCPFISASDLTRGKVLEDFGSQKWKDIWQKLKDGDVDEEVVWRAYRENLELALDEVSLLLENVDAETAIVTSDHGNAIGEWGIYGHPPGMPMECLRVVPWFETTAKDDLTHEPQLEFVSESDTSREEQLAALGYT